MSEWKTRAAIQAALNSYSGAAARLDIDEFLAHFSEDAEFHGVAELMGHNGPLKGAAAIGAFFGPMLASLEWLMQQNTTTDITIGPDGSTARTSTGLVELAKAKGSDQIVLLARYDDELERVDGRWKFTKRTLVPYRFSQVPADIG
jgi:ketosteroid isomerase-like protein